jgi:hypothetical protein
LLKAPSDDIFWLLNQHPATTPEDDIRPPLNESSSATLMKRITAEIKKQTQATINHLTPLIAKRKAANGAQKLLETECEFKAASGILASSDAKRVGYIDPTSNWSIRDLRKQLAALPPIPLSKMYVGIENPDLLVFKDFFETDVLPQETSLLKYYMKLACYNRCSIDHPQLVADVKSGKIAQVKSVEEMAARKNRIQKAKQDLNKKIKDIEGVECELWRDDFCEPYGIFLWWRYHRTELPSQYRTICYRKVVENLGPATSRERVIREVAPSFEVIYVSKAGYNCRGTVQLMIQKQDRPGDAQAIQRYQNEIEDLNAELAGLESDSNTIGQMLDGINAIAQAHDDITAKFDARKQVNFHNTLETIIINLRNWDGTNPVGAAAVDDFCLLLYKFRQRKSRGLLSMRFSGAKIRGLAPKARIWQSTVSPTVTTTFCKARASLPADDEASDMDDGKHEQLIHLHNHLEL